MTENKHRPSHEVEAELRELREEAAALKIELAEMETAMKLKKTRLEALTGGLWSRFNTLIGNKQEELESVKRWEDDASKPVVIWAVAPLRWRDDEEECHVVSRVTPKRIFVRRRGESREEQYYRDGTAVCGFKQTIDVEATLGQMVNP